MTRHDPRFRVLAPQAIRRNTQRRRAWRLGWALILGAAALGALIGYLLADRVVMPL